VRHLSRTVRSGTPSIAATSRADSRRLDPPRVPLCGGCVLRRQAVTSFARLLLAGVCVGHHLLFPSRMSLLFRFSFLVRGSRQLPGGGGYGVWLSTSTSTARVWPYARGRMRACGRDNRSLSVTPRGAAARAWPARWPARGGPGRRAAVPRPGRPPVATCDLE